MTDPQWLNEEEMRIWRGFVELSSRVNHHLDAALRSAADLTMEDYEVLVHLSAAEEQRLRMTELSNLLMHSQSRLSQRIDRLVARGLVAREKCAEDRRGTFAVITTEGMEAITEAAPGHVADVRRFLIDLIEPSERATVARVFERLVDHAREAASV